MANNGDIRILYSMDTNLLDGRLEKVDCLHLLCLEGEGELVYGERTFFFKAHDMLILSRPEAITQLTHSGDMKAVSLVAPLQFLYNQLPANHFGIGGCIDLWDNPVIPMESDSEEKILEDFAHLRDRIGDTGHTFYKELIGSLALTMVYDLFEAHARRDLGENVRERNADLVSRLVDMLSSGMVKEHRDVGFYAGQLNVSPKYLGNLVKRQTGRSVMHLIEQHTIPMIREYLKNNKLSFTQIAGIFHFSNAGHFTRYVQKHIASDSK